MKNGQDYDFFGLGKKMNVKQFHSFGQGQSSRTLEQLDIHRLQKYDIIVRNCKYIEDTDDEQ